MSNTPSTKKKGPSKALGTPPSQLGNNKKPTPRHKPGQRRKGKNGTKAPGQKIFLVPFPRGKTEFFPLLKSSTGGDRKIRKGPGDKGLFKGAQGDRRVRENQKPAGRHPSPGLFLRPFAKGGGRENNSKTSPPPTPAGSPARETQVLRPKQRQLLLRLVGGGKMSVDQTSSQTHPPPQTRYVKVRTRTRVHRFEKAGNGKENTRPVRG